MISVYFHKGYRMVLVLREIRNEVKWTREGEDDEEVEDDWEVEEE